MTLLGYLENGLFSLGQILRFPVMSLLWVCVGAALFMAGGALVEFVVRRRERAGFAIDVWLGAGSVLDGGRRALLPAALRQFVAAVAQAHTRGALADGGLANLVLEREERLRRRPRNAQTLVKVGPLGLIGTLIPMGTSLASLATGDLQAMAGQMVVAFTTTIIGLATGTLAYVVAGIRQSWVNQDVREQRFVAERLAVELGAGVAS